MKSKNFDDSFELAKDHLTCIICLESPTEPILLLCCGRICCRKCLETWLSSQKLSPSCPYCRTEFDDGKEKYISIPWAECLSAILNLYSGQSNEKFMCKVHNKQYEYKCTTCNEFLCSDCIFNMYVESDNKHKGHNLVKINDLLIETKKSIQALLPKLLETLSLVRSQANKIKEMSKDLAEQKRKYDTKINDQYFDVQESLKASFENKKKSLEIQMKSEELDEIKNIILESHKILKKGSGKEIVKQIALLKEVNQRLQKNIIDESNIKIENPLLPDFHTIEIPIPNFVEKVNTFKNRDENEVRFIYSEPKNMAGNKWRAKIFPNGNSNGINTHLSLFVELLRGPQEPVAYHYKVEIIPADPTAPLIWKSFVSEFVQNDSWGWNKVALLSVITNHNYIREDGTLLLRLSVRAASRYQETKDIEARIESIKQKTKDLKNLLASEVLSDDEKV